MSDQAQGYTTQRERECLASQIRWAAAEADSVIDSVIATRGKDQDELWRLESFEEALVKLRGLRIVLLDEARKLLADKVTP